ncbi:GNAT family N-acetyltransferase [Gordonia sp. NPDC003950]
MIVETSRMLLRPVDRRDVDHLVRLDSDPEVMRFVTGGTATPRSTIEGFVVPRAEAELQTGRGGIWTATDRRYGVFLGWVSLRAPRHSVQPELELSYRLRREYWGRGLATEAARVVTDVAFAEFDAQRLFASTTATHASSRRVMEKLGMRMCARDICADPAASDPAASDPTGAGEPEVEYEMLRRHWEITGARYGAATDLTA